MSSMHPMSSHDLLALFVGVTLSTAFYGLTCYQAFLYFTQTAHSSKKIFTIAVTAVMLLLTLTICIWNYEVYWFLVCDRGETPSPEHVAWVPMVAAGVNATIGTVVQLFLGRRLFILSSRNRYLFGMTCALSVTQLGLAWGYMIEGVLSHVSHNLGETLATPSFALTASTDVFITFWMCYFLHTCKSGVPKTDSAVNGLIVMTVHNGLLSSAIALLSFTAGLLDPDGMVHVVGCALLGEAYATSLLSSLNSRVTLRQRLSTQEPYTLTSANTSTRRLRNPESKGVLVQHATYAMGPLAMPPPVQYNPSAESRAPSPIIIMKRVETFVVEK